LPYMILSAPHRDAATAGAGCSLIAQTISLAAAVSYTMILGGSDDLRKVRWAATGRGKRGGVRVIYYWAVDREIILMLLIYGKNEQDDLTAEQLRALKGLVEEEFK
jgi:hypothetical protein